MSETAAFTEYVIEPPTAIEAFVTTSPPKKRNPLHHFPLLVPALSYTEVKGVDNHREYSMTCIVKTALSTLR